MFEQLSVRVVAGMLLWSSAWVLLSVLYFTRVLPYAGAISDIQRLDLMLSYMIPAAFIGAIAGGLINAFTRPLWINVGALIGAALGLQFGRRLAPFDFPFASDPNANGLIMMGLFSFVGALVGLVLRAKQTPLPFRLPRDRAQVALEELELLRAKRPAEGMPSDRATPDEKVQ